MLNELSLQILTEKKPLLESYRTRLSFDELLKVAECSLAYSSSLTINISVEIRRKVDKISKDELL